MLAGLFCLQLLEPDVLMTLQERQVYLNHHVLACELLNDFLWLGSWLLSREQPKF
jgi:hypothetical protein